MSVPLLATAMLITGIANSILTKLQDQQCVANCDGPNPEYFDQPVFQSVQMFTAEAAVWLVARYLYRKPVQPKALSHEEDGLILGNDGKHRKPLRVWLLSIPATCDILGTTMMNCGLILVPVSIYQMLRGSIVLCVATLSIVALKRRISPRKWLALVLVFVGVAVVGLSARQDPVDGKSGAEVTIGLCMIMLAQIFSATQYVVEEYLLETYELQSLYVVGYEGIWGFLFTTVGALIISFFAAPDSIFNIYLGFKQVLSSPGLLISSIGIMFMMGTFNVTGVAVTRALSATARSTIDTSRTVGIWIVSICIGWEVFSLIQMFGFVVLVIGTLLFNGVIYPEIEKDEDGNIVNEESPLLPEEFEHT